MKQTVYWHRLSTMLTNNALRTGPNVKFGLGRQMSFCRRGEDRDSKQPGDALWHIKA